MKWKIFQDKYDEWSDSTVLKYIHQLEDLGTSSEIAGVCEYLDSKAALLLIRKADAAGIVFSPRDIADISNCLDDPIIEHLVETAIEKGNHAFQYEDICELEFAISKGLMARVITDSLRRGVIFTPDQIIEMDGMADKAVLTQALKKVMTRLSEEDLEALDEIVDHDYLVKIDRKQNSHVFDEDEEVFDEFDYSEDARYRKTGLLDSISAFLAIDFLYKRFFRKKDDDEKKKRRW